MARKHNGEPVLLVALLTSRLKGNRWLGVALSLGIVAAAFLIRYYTDVTLRFVTFYPAVMLCGFFGGWRAGVAATFMSLGLVWTFFSGQSGTVTFSRGELFNGAAFVVVSLIIVAVIHALTTALVELDKQKREAEAARLKAEDAERETGTLMREMLHRSRNDYTVMSFIARSETRGDPSRKHVGDAIAGRLQSLARSHELLLGSFDESIDLGTLVHGQLEPFCGRHRYRADGPSLTLESNMARYIGLALHELSTNASKHGALSIDEGLIDLSWKEQAGRLELQWQEAGVAAIAPGESTGFGRELLERLVPQALNGTATLEFGPAGLGWRLSAPLRD